MRIFLIALLVLPLAAAAQEEAAAPASAVPSCDEAEYRQFDFWIGDWAVTSNDQPAGANRVHTILDGCALQENWQGSGPGGVSGTSFNIYDKANGRWHQTWVDSTGTLLQLDGGLVDGVMVMSGQRPAPDGKGVTLHRISWTASPDGTVRQLWEASTDNGGNWKVLFDGLYQRRADNP
jgi:hypothetical protein